MKQVCKVIFAVLETIFSPVKCLLAIKSKTLVRVSVFTLAMISLTLTSCTKSELKPVTSSQGGNGGGGGGTNPNPTPVPTPAPNPPTSLPIAEVVVVGTWKVSSYVEVVENSTKKFSSFTFTFLSDRTLLVKNGGSTITGTWTPAEAIFYYGIPSYGSNPNGFFININSGLPLSLLSKNFFVSFKSLSSFTLESINPAEDTHVIFSK